MLKYRDNLLAQFSVVTFVIMLILALIVSVILIESLNRNVQLLTEHNSAVEAGEAIEPSDPYSIPSLRRQVNSLKWITLGAIGGSFVYLYATLVYLVWEGSRTIVKQRVQLETVNAELESRVAERVKELAQALEDGRRRLDAFRTAAGRLALEEDPERALLNLVDVTRDLVGARYAALALPDGRGGSGKFVSSGFEGDLPAGDGASPKAIEDLGLARDGEGAIIVTDPALHRGAHGLAQDEADGNSFLGAPVTAKGRSAGAFYLMEKDGEADFSGDDQRLLNLFAGLAGVHVENVDLYDAVALERSTLAAIQAGMTEGLMVLGPDGRVMYLNETAESMWGLDSDDAPGKTLPELLDPAASGLETADSVGDLVGLAGGADNAPESVDVVVARPQRRHLEVTAFSIPATLDRTMTELLSRDVTQDRELQERRNAFISIASHELRTPMTAIMGFSELMLRRAVPDASRQEWLGRIHQNSQILKAIVDDMLDVSRIQSGKLALDLQHLDLPSVVEEVLAGIKPETGIHEFAVNIPPETPEVVADKEKLAQILINLVTNAVKYSPEGGEVGIHARHEDQNERVVVQVSDQGMGIAPENLDQLFGTFHRIRRPETEAIRGTGLGLNIVRGLVMMMRGQVWVESELNKGTTFFFSVPTQRVDMVEGAWQASRTSGGPNGEKGTTG